jgi:hypothetical protein
MIHLVVCLRENPESSYCSYNDMLSCLCWYYVSQLLQMYAIQLSSWHPVSALKTFPQLLHCADPLQGFETP